MRRIAIAVLCGLIAGCQVGCLAKHPKNGDVRHDIHKEDSKCWYQKDRHTISIYMDGAWWQLQEYCLEAKP